MLKRIFIYILLILAITLNTCVVAAFAATGDSNSAYDEATVAKIIDKTDIFELKAKSAILMDAVSGNILLEKNSHERLPIASITKIMSLLLIMEAIESGKLSFEDTVVVSESAYRMGGSQVWLEPGEKFTVSEMLKAVAISSANDATVALAEKVAGSEEAFVAMMNEKARELNMNDTNFLDCTGLTDEGHYSSAYDIAIMSRELITKHPKITEFTTIWHDLFRKDVEGKKPVSLDNTNKLIRFYEGATGLKTGFTNAAGYCLSATAKRNNLHMIAVVLGEPDSNTRFAESRKMLDYAFANYETVQVDNKGDIIQEIEVKKGLTTRVNSVLADDVILLLKKGEKGKVEREIRIEPSITAPVKAGQKVGEVVYVIEGKEIRKVDAIAETDVQRASFLRLLFRMILEWFGIGRK